MARYDLYASPSGEGYLLDLQSDLLQPLGTRVVAPLFRDDKAPPPSARLNPLFEIAGQRYVMMTQMLAAVPQTELGRTQGNLAEQSDKVTQALDMLFQGF